MAVLPFIEQGVGDGPGGVVDGEEQREPRSPTLQSVVPAPVHLQQHPLLRHPLPSAAVSGRSSTARTGQLRLYQDPAQRGARHHDPLALRQQLGQVSVIHSRISLPHHTHHLLLHVGKNRVGRLSTSIPMGQRSGSFLPIRRQYPPHMALTQPQNLGRFPCLHLAAQHPIQYP